MHHPLLLLSLLCVLAPRLARADTPAQVQKAIQAVCDRAAAATIHKDLAGAMACFASSFVMTTIAGRRYNYLQTQAAIASEYTRPNVFGTLSHTVGPVTLHGDTAQSILTFRDTDKHSGTAKNRPYTYTRVYTESTTWVKGPQGWQETSSQILRDVMTYSR